MKLYLVETKNEVFVSQRKLDTVYKHVEYEYGEAKYREVDSRNFKTKKKVIDLQERE